MKSSNGPSLKTETTIALGDKHGKGNGTEDKRKCSSYPSQSVPTQGPSRIHSFFSILRRNIQFTKKNVGEQKLSFCSVLFVGREQTKKKNTKRVKAQKSSVLVLGKGIYH